MLRKKILYVITKSVWGGAQRYVFDLATNLSKDRFEIVVAAGGEGPLFYKLRNAGIRTINTPSLERNVHILNETSVFWQLLKIFHIEKPDIIHLNSTKIGALGALAAFVYKLLTLNFKLLTVFTVHGWGFKETRPRWQKFLIWLASWFSSFFQDKIILIDTADLKTAQRFIPRKKLVLIPNGINSPNFLSRAEARAFFSQKIGTPITNDVIVIGTIAELTKNKGLEFLVTAASQVKSITPTSKFIIPVMGDGENREKLKNQVNHLKLDGTVFLLGFLPDVSRYLKGLDIFILPSLKEGLPYTIMEAMAAGLPIITTKVGGIPDLIKPGFNGTLVSPGNPSELARAIRYIIENGDKAYIFGRNSLDIVKERFSLQVMLEKTTALYQSR